MTYLIILMSLLAVLAGVISYTGDVLGTIVGKRRLSLFGARPKRSGQIIGVLAGVLIMLVTLTILALAFSNARRVLFDFQSTTEQNVQLNAQQKFLTQSVTGLEARLAEQNQELEAARLGLDKALRDRNVAVRDKDKAQAELEKLEDEQAGLIADIETLDFDVKTLKTDLEVAQSDLGEAQLTLNEAEENLATAQTERQEAKEDVAKARAEVEQAREDVAELERQVAEARSQLDTVQTELDSSQRELKNAQEDLGTTRTELEGIKTELDAKQTELDGARRDLDEALRAKDDAVQARDEAQQQQETLSEKNEQLNTLNEDLESINATLRTQVSEQNAELGILKADVALLRSRLEEQTNALALAQDQAQAVNSRDLTYTVNQIVHTGIIDAQDLSTARAQVAEFLTAANDKAVQTRAGNIALEPGQMDRLVQDALQTSGADVVTLRSKQNQYVSEPLSVTVEVAENKVLLEEGQLVVTQQIHLGSPEFQEQRDSVRSDLTKLFTSANSSLLAKGLADGVYPVTSESSLEIEGFTNQLLRLSGPVVVGLSASETIYSGGPAKLEFIILN